MDVEVVLCCSVKKCPHYRPSKFKSFGYCSAIGNVSILYNGQCVQASKISQELDESSNKSYNTKRDVICSDSMCDYCIHINCTDHEGVGKCFNGRKLSPVL